MTHAADALLASLGHAIDATVSASPSLYTRDSRLRAQSIDLPSVKRKPDKLRRLVEAGLVVEGSEAGNRAGAHHLTWGLTAKGWATYDLERNGPRLPPSMVPSSATSSNS